MVKRAAFVVPADRSGGAERITAALIAELLRRGDWEAQLHFLQRRPQTSFFEAAGIAVPARYGAGSGHFPDEWLALPAICAQGPYDLVFSSHLRVNAALAAARRAGWLKTARLVARESTVIADRVSPLRLLPYRMLYRMYGAQDLIVAQTSYMAERLRDLLPRRAHRLIDVVPNPIDVAAVQRQAREAVDPDLHRRLSEAPHIVWCGRFIAIKQPARALHALKHARMLSGQDLRLLMIGEGEQEPELRRLAEELGIADLVLFAGHQANPYKFMRLCKVGLVTSDREGFPNVLLEMMACGVPHIVTTPCAGDLDGVAGVNITRSFAHRGLADEILLFARTPVQSFVAANLNNRSTLDFADAVLAGQPSDTSL